MRQRYRAPLIVAALMIGLAGVIIFNHANNQAYNELSEGISRGNVAKSLALALVDKDVCLSTEQNYFPEEDKDSWYVPYMNYLYMNGYWSQQEIPARRDSAEGRMKYQEIAPVLQRLQMEEQVRSYKEGEELTAGEWWDLYKLILHKYDPDKKVGRKTITLYQTAANLSEAKPWEAYTDIGVLGFDGLALDYYLGKQILVMFRGTEIIRVFGEGEKIDIEEPPTVDPLPLEQPAVQETDLRILIQTSDYGGKLHDNVSIACPEGFKIIANNVQMDYAPGEVVTITPSHLTFIDGPVTVIPNGSSELILSSVHRPQGSPSYPGKLELSLQGSQISVTNIVDIERYLTRVVPSEMPARYGLEAAKIQAICARTYAYQKLISGQYPEYGAHMDDSTNYQVYNSVGEQEVSSQGVSETAGQILTCQGQIITPYYFSTSCGYTANNQIWGADATGYPYISAQKISQAGENLDLTDKETFRAFILNKEYPAYEIGFPWYRWEYSLDLESLKSMIESRLPALIANRPHNVLTVGENGTTSEAVSPAIGKLISLEVTTRYAGGIAAELKITGTAQTILVRQESSIRTVLGAPDQIYQNKSESGSGKSEGNYLPSAFFCLEPVMDGSSMIGYTICGGGNGHGIGMSQNGAYAMTMQGKDYGEILSYFYPGTQISQIP